MYTSCILVHTFPLHPSHNRYTFRYSESVFLANWSNRAAPIHKRTEAPWEGSRVRLLGYREELEGLGLVILRDAVVAGRVVGLALHEADVCVRVDEEVREEADQYEVDLAEGDHEAQDPHDGAVDGPDLLNRINQCNVTHGL